MQVTMVVAIPNPNALPSWLTRIFRRKPKPAAPNFKDLYYSRQSKGTLPHAKPISMKSFLKKTEDVISDIT